MAPSRKDGQDWNHFIGLFGLFVVAPLWFLGLVVTIIAGGGAAFGGYFLMTLGVALCVVARGWIIIPSEPLTAALFLTLDSPKTARGHGPGPAFQWPWEKVIPIPYGEHELGIDHEVLADVAKTGAAKIKIRVFVRYQVNLNDLYDFHRVGQHAGVQKRLEETVSEVLREVAAKTRWEDIVAFEQHLNLAIYRHMFDVESLEDSALVKIIKDDSAKLHDMQDLGIIIGKINVTKIEVLGRLADSIDRKVEEQVQRVAERIDLETREQLAKRLMTEAKKHGCVDVSYIEAFRYITEAKQIDEDHGTVIRIPGADQLIENLLNKIFRDGKEGT